MGFFIFLLGLSGAASSLLCLMASAVFKRGDGKKLKRLLLVSIAAVVIGFIATVCSDDINGAWAIPTFLMFIVNAVFTIRYIVIAFQERNVAEELRDEFRRQRNHEKAEKRELRARERGIREQEKAGKREILAQKNAEKRARKQRDKAARREYDRLERDRKRVEADAARKLRLERRRLAKEIKRVTIIGSDSKASVGSAVSRAIVGDFLAGDIGAIIGASTGKKRDVTKFLIEYADGHKTMETVDDNSQRFMELIKYLEM